MDLDGPGLHALGATLEVLGTRDYSLPGTWTRALYDHPGQPDGIWYPCRHDNREYAIALFDRARAALGNTQSRPLLDDPGFLADMARVYHFGIG
ncbi:MAG TPA: RES domain-containing protein [Longimicrobiaceae bacterium]|nr:RES domain-containing protein [Longimicrobiaceae bacterium]